jgi:hypothetical protein
MTGAMAAFTHNMHYHGSISLLSQIRMSVWMSLRATPTENVSTSTGDFTVVVTVATLEMEWRIAQV